VLGLDLIKLVFIKSMKKIAILLCLLGSFSAYGEIYSPGSIKEIKEMAADIFAKRNPEKTVFIFPLETFILRPIHPALQKYDESYNALLKKAFSAANVSKNDFIDELILLDYPHEVADPAIVDLIDYIQENKAGAIIITPNLSGGINKVEHFDIWTFDYLKGLKIDLDKGRFANTKIVFNKELKKVEGTYPTFYKGLLSYNTNGRDNSAMQALSVLFAGKFKKFPEVIVAVSPSKNFLEALEKQMKILKKDSQFFGILYNPKPNKSEISPEDYLKFWQDFVKKLNNVKRKGVDLKSENPYED
jgi:hypothetical protein